MAEEKGPNFIEEIIEHDLKTGKVDAVTTRFPPEPNGYLHVGHAKSICLNFGLALKYGGKTNLRFDDTNPVTEEVEYVESIKADVRWLGFQWSEERYASDYFEQLYGYAVKLIEKNLAYVDDSTSEEIAQMKGTPTQPGVDSPYRARTVAENLRLFSEMRAGKYRDGEKVLRARVDMASPNMLMRDPLLYRIKHAHHHRTGNQWCIYPMYDFAHGQSDSIEKITHSICTLEFIPHRELYEWLIRNLEIWPSKQYEFARLNMTYTVMSKRKLLELVQEGHVSGWNDPRMPTISGMRRRGFTPESIRDFCDKIGVAKRENLIDIGLLEFCVREHLNKSAHRRMVVFDPLKVVITNYPPDQTEMLQGENNPEDPQSGNRQIPFSAEIFIEQDDFMEEPPKKYFRLAPGQMVRLKHAYIIRCTSFIKDQQGAVTEVHAEYIPESKSGHDTSGISVKGTLHWVSIKHALPIQVRLYDRLFNVENPAEMDGEFMKYLNPESLMIKNVFAEPSLKSAGQGEKFQFLRMGYYTPDIDSSQEYPIFNRTVTLRDHWLKEQKK
jgi:glutaminyl-tRNA synthetase